MIDNEGVTTVRILSALHFAAEKHRDQRRKGAEASPYINHPIEVAEVIARRGGVTDPVVLQAAILHDTLEDTRTTHAELESVFGREVADVVLEVTDDKALPSEERKRLHGGAARQAGRQDRQRAGCGAPARARLGAGTAPRLPRLGRAGHRRLPRLQRRPRAAL
jgi:(p)ppGpp synthase/HD superfamily hydrolase